MSDNPNSPSVDPRELELGQCILVDLDYLIDTRLGALTLLDEDCIVPIMEKGYWERTHDFFERLVPSIDRKKYQAIYDKRDWKVLAAGRMCNSILWLSALTRTMEARMTDTPYQFPVVVYINIFPYDLSETEVKILGSVISDHLAVTTQVRMVSKPNDTITPEWIKTNISLLAKYDGDEWLRVNAELLMKTPLPTITLLLPALLKDEEAISSMAKGVDGKDYNLFEELPKGMAVLIDMLYVPLNDVSVINPRVVKQMKEYNEQKHKEKEQ